MTRPVPLLDDVFTDEFFTDPHRVYARLRERGPVHRVLTPNRQRVWLVIGHAEARTVFADPRFGKDGSVAARIYDRHTDPSVRDRDFAPSVSEHLLNTDPPRHTRLRRLVATAFTPRTVAELRARIVEITTRAVDQLADRLGTGAVVDLLEALAVPVPVTVICELLGVPEAVREPLRAAATDLTSIGDPARVDRASRTLASLLAQTLGQKRSDPGDDLLTALAAAHDDGDRLSERELLSMAMILVVAGHDTTVNLIANGVLALFADPTAGALLQADRGLLPAAVEEIVRFDGPVNTATFRFTTAPVDLGDVVIPAEHPVVVSPLAANRDPARFPDPDTFRIGRDTAGHLAFGHGIHHCVGAALARLEAPVVLDALLERLPDLTLAVPPGALRYRRSILVRGLRELPVVRADRHPASRGRSLVKTLRTRD